MALLDEVAALDFDDLCAALAAPPAPGRHRRFCVAVRQLRIGWPCVCALIRQGRLPKKRQRARGVVSASAPTQRSPSEVRAELESAGQSYLVRGRSDSELLALASHLWGETKEAAAPAEPVQLPIKEGKKRRGWAAVIGGDGRPWNRGSPLPERYYTGGSHDLHRVEQALKAGTVVRVVLLVRWVSRPFQRRLKALCRHLGVPVELQH